MNKMVELARSCVGLKESDGSFRKIIDVYNSHKPLARGYKMKYTDAWCATFISYLSIECGYTDIVPTECGCERQIDLFKNLGEWVENDAYIPKEGDIIYYDWQDSGKGDNKGWSDHVGIVESCDGKTITVIEGNKNDSVSRRCIGVDARYIRGFAVPRYPDNTPKIEEFVERLYTIVLGRKSDPTGKQSWVHLLKEGLIGASTVMHGFFFSPEFMSKNVSDGDYVTKLYKAALNREPDKIGFDSWCSKLKNGVSRELVFNGFVDSPEFMRLCNQYGIIK